MRDGPLRTPSLKEIETYDAVIVIGEDPTNIRSYAGPGFKSIG